MKTKKKTLVIKRAREEKQWRLSLPALFVLAKDQYPDLSYQGNVEVR